MRHRYRFPLLRQHGMRNGAGSSPRARPVSWGSGTRGTRSPSALVIGLKQADGLAAVVTGARAARDLAAAAGSALPLQVLTSW